MSVPFRMDPTGNLGLPAGYQLCEYLQSTGTQYIDTGVNISSNVDTKLEYTAVGYNSSRGVFGVEKSTNNYAYYFYFASGAKAFQVCFGPFSSYKNIQNYDANKHIVEFKFPDVSIDGVTLYTSSYSSIPELGTAYLFGMRNYSSNAMVKIYSLVLSKHTTEELLLNFIPALAPQDKNGNPTPNGTPCMFDTVTQKPFYNAGTGEFQYALASTPPLGLTDLLEDYSEDLERRAA